MSGSQVPARGQAARFDPRAHSLLTRWVALTLLNAGCALQLRAMQQVAITQSIALNLGETQICSVA
jgi:hypothetical protein